MAKYSLLLLSIFIFTGCYEKYDITVNAPSKIFVPKYHDKNVTVKAVKKDGKITLSVSDFNKRTNQILKLKGHAQTVDEIVENYNSYDYTNKGKQNE